MPIALSRPDLTDEEIRAAEAVLRSGWLVYGKENRSLEEELAAACGVRYAATVSSGTAALHLVMLALEAELVRDVPAQQPVPVLVPALTFPATANVLHFLRHPCQVWLGDIDPETLCLPSETLLRWLSAGCGPCMLVHQFGCPATLPPRVLDSPDLLRLLISDAACAIGVPAAMKGRAVCLSFHPRKLLTTGEGGAVLTDDAALFERVRALRAHGLAANPGQEVMALATPGLNYRLGEIGAAVGRVQLRRLPAIVARHAELAALYRSLLADLPLTLQAAAPTRIDQTFAVGLPAGVDRQAVRRDLLDRGIETQIASYGLHRLAAYQNSPVFGPTEASPPTLAVADRVHDRGLALPLHTALSDADVRTVCEALKRAL